MPNNNEKDDKQFNQFSIFDIDNIIDRGPSLEYKYVIEIMLTQRIMTLYTDNYLNQE